MPRPLRQFEPDVCYHVLNRGNNRQQIFFKDGDYEAFLSVLAVALSRFDVELLCWCLMPNHWHLVLRPRRRGNLSAFMRWLTHTHVLRHHEHYRDQTGHLYQGRFKSFPVENDTYFLVLGRYVEANALRANLVDRAEDWKWSSLRQRLKRQKAPLLADWPVDRPAGWLEIVNENLSEDQTEMIQASITRNRPLGPSAWVSLMAKKLGLSQSLPNRGRPLKREISLSKRQQQRRKRLERLVSPANT
jgi:putative transposase